MSETLKVLEFGSWQEETTKTGHDPTTTKWFDRVWKDERRSRARAMSTPGSRFQPSK